MDISQNLINIIKSLPEEQRKVIIKEFIEEPLTKLTNAYKAMKEERNRKVELKTIREIADQLVEDGYIVFDSVKDDDYEQKNTASFLKYSCLTLYQGFALLIRIQF